MKRVFRKFFVGALVLSIGLTSIGLTPRTAAEAGLPKIPKIPSIRGLSSKQLQTILQNSAARQALVSLLIGLAQQHYLVTGANFDPISGVLTVYSKNFKTGQTRVDTILLFGDEEDQGGAT